MNRAFAFSIFVVCVLLNSDCFSQDKPKAKYWVFFKDKQVTSLSKSNELLEIAKSRISTRALKRRRKVKKGSNLIDHHDLPVSRDYLSRLEAFGYKAVVVSNWLNGASYLLTAEEVTEIKKLIFVKEVRPVAKAARMPIPPTLKPAGPMKRHKQSSNNFSYGASISQNELINVPKVHDLGITGKGVWVGMLDTGFKYRDHEAFENLEVIAERDFINNDGVTEDEPGQDPPGQHVHGTLTLSTISGFKEGELIGPAFDASFLLAKTEDITEEVPAEEDNWVAGIEWLESQGVDVVSSSIGYIDFYVPSDMDGNTAVITKAADLAVGRGVVVVNSAGNEGNAGWRIIIAPADGDSVIAVGAVTSTGDTTFFSSAGPTADGRIKPDVLAMGAGVYTAVPSSNKSSSRYDRFSGTSLSCPSVAGVAALVLSAHPWLTPIEVRDALRMTADRAANPDDDFYKFGWGLVNAYDAVLFHGMAFSNSPEMIVNNNGDLEVKIKVASRFGVDPSKVSLSYSRTDGSFDRVITMTRGSEEHQYLATITDVAGVKEIKFYFMSADSSGAEAIHPFNAPDSSFSFINTTVSVETGLNEVPESYRLAQNYPNPFNPATTIMYDLPAQSRVSITIINLLGQVVKTLIDNKTIAAGHHSVTWDGTDNSGKFVATSVYFYHFQTDSFRDVKKMLLIR